MRLHRKYIAKAAILTFGICLSLTSIVNAKTNGIVNTDRTNVRIKPSSDVLKQVNKNTSVSVVGKENKWYKIVLEDGKQGYIYEDLLNLDFQGTVTGIKVNLRKQPNLEASVVGQAPEGTVLSIGGKISGWYKVSFNKQWVWISEEFLKVEDAQWIPTISASTSQGIEAKNTDEAKNIKVSRSGELNRDITTYAKKYIGVRYVWGGSSPNGFDCSGFTSYVMKQYGVSIDRIAADQATNGSFVGKDNLEKGDLVFFNTGGSGISHVGMYIGDGQFIHASSGKGSVTISSINEGYYNERYITGRRVLR